MIALWDTRAPRDPEFERRWAARVVGSPYANFALSLDWLRHEAALGRHARAVLAEEGGRTGAIVLRAEPRGWTSGWPWRWQAMIAGKDANGALGITAEESAWLFARACEAAEVGGRVRCFLPHPPPAGVPGFIAGATIIQSVQHSDEEILRGMGSSKRRMVRRAQSLGYEVNDAREPHVFAEFHRVQLEAHRRRPPMQRIVAPPGSADWTEWELPWMWLLVARKNGVVHSGVGDSVIPGGYVDGRTAAATLEGRSEGASALLGFEEARRARDRGHRWLNHGGDTFWKREISGRLGERFPLWCWLSGRRFSLPNTAETTWMSFRPVAARWMKKWRPGKSS